MAEKDDLLPIRTIFTFLYSTLSLKTKETSLSNDGQMWLTVSAPPPQKLRQGGYREGGGGGGKALYKAGR